LVLRIGKIASISSGSSLFAKARIQCKFWGDNQGALLRSANTTAKELAAKFPCEISYDILCSIWHFHKYLLDMGTLKLSILDLQDRQIGLVAIKFKMFVSKRYIFRTFTFLYN
jgi:hypothetical protein